jgi:hypothetical protein
MTVLKNGNTGIGFSNPQRLLHVYGGAGGNQYHSNALAILEDSDDMYLQFSNPIPNLRVLFPETRVRQSEAHYFFCQIALFKSGREQMLPGWLSPIMEIRVIGTLSLPQDSMLAKAPQEVICFQANAAMIVEDNNTCYIQLSTSDTYDAGILSGNSQTAIRSAIVLRADSTIQFRTGGNSTKMTILEDGNIGIGTSTPSQRFACFRKWLFHR